MPDWTKIGPIFLRGSQHASSSSVASAGSSLARDLSIRSENVTSNRVLSGRPRSRDATKSARLATGKRLFYLDFVQSYILDVKIELFFAVY